MKTCNFCGNPVAPTAKSCPNCGNREPYNCEICKTPLPAGQDLCFNHRKIKCDKCGIILHANQAVVIPTDNRNSITFFCSKCAGYPAGTKLNERHTRCRNCFKWIPENQTKVVVLAYVRHSNNQTSGKMDHYTPGIPTIDPKYGRMCQNCARTYVEPQDPRPKGFWANLFYNPK